MQWRNSIAATRGTLLLCMLLRLSISAYRGNFSDLCPPLSLQQSLFLDGTAKSAHYIDYNFLSPLFSCEGAALEVQRWLCLCVCDQVEINLSSFKCQPLPFKTKHGTSLISCPLVQWQVNQLETSLECVQHVYNVYKCTLNLEAALEVQRLLCLRFECLCVWEQVEINLLSFKCQPLPLKLSIEPV